MVPCMVLLFKCFNYIVLILFNIRVFHCNNCNFVRLLVAGFKFLLFDSERFLLCYSFDCGLQPYFMSCKSQKYRVF